MSTSSATLPQSDAKLVDDVITFWLGKTTFSRYDSFDHMKKLWSAGGEETDTLIRTQFGSDVERALDGKLDHLISDGGAKGRLAVTILLDQFPRNIYRGTAKAFSGDAKCREIVDPLFEPSMWKAIQDALSPMVCVIFMTPLMHQEALSDLNLYVSTAEAMLKELKEDGDVAKDCVTSLQNCLNFAKKHRDIIAKFGRYPYRNAVLQRESTPEELEFIVDGPRFGQ